MSVRRPRQQPSREALSADERGALAARASYADSPEHKDRRWWGGLPQGRRPRPKKQLTTICPLVTKADQNTATALVRAAIAKGNYRFLEGDGDFPSRLWYVEQGQAWEARCINRDVGCYKGWPVDESDLRALLD